MSYTRTPRPSNGDIDKNNSTTNVLDINEVYLGVATDITSVSSVAINVKTSTSSDRTAGLQIEISPDGINWDIYETHIISREEYKSFAFSTTSMYYRLRYTNSHIRQTYFRLQSIIYYGKEVETSISMGSEYLISNIRSDILGAVRMDTPGALVGPNKICPLQVGMNGGLRIDTTELQKMSEILSQILVQQRIMNMHLESMTGNNISPIDVTDDDNFNQ